ncbi:hypothetical protein [Epilithonimonas hungarica]|uniref:Uncharacterized protein n=1 Tax=Epilithonimonas hungarica TaxID=454006 RepID=A0A1G7H1F6_9FLAO|nr:hypothetical protein [Epilithonimonas hungarica]MDP9956663.1 hypothetical protein [Epilithonimonas hungarica]MPT32733.1 hypothetical protein [Chryseobacterium sp.]SDE94171.1 hypothetical protein SAMN05421825_0651 [Epilithonimonas hungarica]
MYIIIAVALVLLTLFLINSKLFDGMRTRKARSFEFFISLISTFIGFFIALSLNTILSDINQKKNLVKLLDATNLSLENSVMKTQGMYLNAAKKGADISEIIQYAPVEIPKLYSNLETNSLVSDYFLSNAFQAYILCNDNLQTFVKSANATNATSEKKIQILEKYLAYLNLAKQVNTLEVKRLNGDISRSDEDQELQKLTKQIINNQ